MFITFGFTDHLSIHKIIKTYCISLNVLRVIRILHEKAMCFKLLCRSNGVRAVFAFQFSVIFCPGKEKIQHLLNDCYQVRMVDWF